VRKFLLVGLTGGIATGKSTVSDVLRRLGAEIIDADVLAREVVEPGQPAHAAIVEEFGISDKVVSSTGIRQISYSLGEKVLGITCDNASNNDAMVAELEDLVPGFSRVNHTRCFLHVNNLVARTLVRQFDIPKATATANAPWMVECL